MNVLRQVFLCQTMLLRIFLVVLLLEVCHSTVIRTRHRYRYGDSGWPDDETWQAFNASISGRLTRTFPSAAVCHGDQYDAGKCSTAKQEWSNSFWRTNQTGAYTAIVWELGQQQCFVNSSEHDPCEQGLGDSALSSLTMIC